MVQVVFNNILCYSNIMTNINEAIAAGYDDVRTNQIGGETDGITVEVAEDLGMTTPERLAALVLKKTKTQPKRKKTHIADDTDPWGR